MSREWNDGDEVVLVLPLQPRFAVADPRLDVARGTVAVVVRATGVLHGGRRQPRTPAGRPHHHTAIAPKVAPVAGTLGRVATIRIGGRIRPRTGASWWPYNLAGAPARDELGESVALTGVPYYTWGNREPGAMRIWISTA